MTRVKIVIIDEKNNCQCSIAFLCEEIFSGKAQFSKFLSFLLF